MNRRQFMQGTVAAAVLQSLPFSVFGQSNGFEAQLKQKPWLLGWQGVDQDALTPMRMNVAGKIPEELQGVFLRNGPAKQQRNGERYQHWFDGDGMVQKYTLSEQGIVHQGQFIHTAKYLKEQEAGKFLYNAAGTQFKNAKPSRNNDSSNTANTALLPWDDEVLALWEGGSAYRLDVDSLQTKGLKTWREDLKHMPFSAHPLVDTDGTLWNFGLAPYAGKDGMMFIYKISAKSGLEKVQPIKLPMAGFMHDFAITERHLVFYVPPYHYSAAHGDTYVDRFAWSPDKGGKLLVVDKNDLTKQRWFDAPSGFIFHFGNAYQKGNDIVINACWYNDPGIMQHGMSDMMGSGNPVEFAHAHASILKLNLATEKVELEQTDIGMEFPVFDERFGSQQATAIFAGGTSAQSSHRHIDRVMRWDVKSGKTDHFDFAEGVIAEEPLFVPRKGGNKEGEGYLINTFLDFNKRQTGITVFNSQAVADGPIVVAKMDRATPLGFHGCFI